MWSQTKVQENPAVLGRDPLIYSWGEKREEGEAGCFCSGRFILCLARPEKLTRIA